MNYAEMRERAELAVNKCAFPELGASCTDDVHTLARDVLALLGEVERKDKALANTQIRLYKTLYEYWSENHWCASWLSRCKQTDKQFFTWLAEVLEAPLDEDESRLGKDAREYIAALAPLPDGDAR